MNYREKKGNGIYDHDRLGLQCVGNVLPNGQWMVPWRFVRSVKCWQRSVMTVWLLMSRRGNFEWIMRMTVAMRMADTEYAYDLRGAELPRWHDCLCVCANDVDLGLVRWLHNPMWQVGISPEGWFEKWRLSLDQEGAMAGFLTRW